MNALTSEQGFRQGGRKPRSSSRIELAHNIFRGGGHPLDALFSPRTVAVISAAGNKNGVAAVVTANLTQSGFTGRVFSVNPGESVAPGTNSYSDVRSLPERPDLAVVIAPLREVPEIIKNCVEADVPKALLISPDFEEAWEPNLPLERQILAEARKGEMRVMGPNCLGIMSPRLNLNASFASTLARPGNVAFLSQSGALCTAILDWSLRENVGFSAFVSVGQMLDVGWGDLIYHFGEDPHTHSIVIYMEAIGDARKFLSAAREVALSKPIIVLKPGRTAPAARGAASHTRTLAEDDEVLQAAFQRVGVLRVDTVSELFHMAEVLAKQPRPSGPRLTVVTNAGAAGVLAADALVTSGGQLADLTPDSVAALHQCLPAAWSRQNPVDLTGGATPELYTRAVEIAAKDANTDGLLVIVTPQTMADPTTTAEQLKALAHIDGKPILATLMGAGEVEKGEQILNQADIPTFKNPDEAARAFGYMWRYSQNLKSLYETPSLQLGSFDEVAARSAAGTLIQNVQKTGRTILTELESKQLLAAYGIPTVETHVARSEQEAVKLAAHMGFPVVLKLFSETITRKSDVGGVQLHLRTASAVRLAWKAIQTSVAKKAGPEHFLGVTVQPMIKLEGFELIVGSRVDSQFGPVLLFGAGGHLVEVFKDRALGLPPLNATLALRMMERTRIFTALGGVRGRKAVSIGALEQLLVRFSQLVVEQKWIAEIEINPLLASSERIFALDARAVLHDAKTPFEKLPGTAIRPYPTQYSTPWKLKNKALVVIRPIRPEDEPLMVKFHETLSEESVYHRYFSALKLSQRVAHERLTRICFNDYDREIALVVELLPHRGKGREIIGVGRLSKLHAVNEAEFALVISDQWQKQGLGTELLKRLVQIGRDEQLDRITAIILPDNYAMQHVSRKAGFKLTHDNEAGEILAEYAL